MNYANVNFEENVIKFSTYDEAEAYPAKLRKRYTDVFRVWLKGDFFIVEQDIK